MRTFAVVAIFVGCAVCFGACRSASPDTTGFAQVNTSVVDASFPETWDYVKTVLREHEYVIYTRDKRGLFLAFTQEKRRRLIPVRTQFTVTLASVSDAKTEVTVETIQQEYGVTLKTYPSWHDLPTKENADGLAILEEVRRKASVGVSGS